jgi:hypothetical protein
MTDVLETNRVIDKKPSWLRRHSPLVFPSAAADALSHGYFIYRDYDDYQTWNDVFNPIIES